MPTMPSAVNSPDQILTYLREKMPRYPFEPNVDKDFVEELLDDFSDVSVLEEIKAFRWYYVSRQVNHVRVAIRRWLARAPARSQVARRKS